MAVAQVRNVASSAPAGLVVIIVLVAIAAFIFTKRRTRAKLKRIEQDRFVLTTFKIEGIKKMLKFSFNFNLTYLNVCFRGEYSEYGDTSFQTSSLSIGDLADTSPEQFWRESESPSPSPPATRTSRTAPASPDASPNHRVHRSLTPKFTKLFPGTPAAVQSERVSSPQSELESPNHSPSSSPASGEECGSPPPPFRLSPGSGQHSRAFTPVYLPRSVPRKPFAENPRNILQNPLNCVLGGGESRAVMTNTLSFQLDQSFHQVNIHVLN